jgi:hypothetical protein
MVRRAKAFARHDGGGAEDHQNANYHQKQNRTEHPFINADAFCH